METEDRRQQVRPQTSGVELRHELGAPHRVKPLVQMGYDIQHQHLLIHDSLRNVQRLLTEATSIQHELDETTRARRSAWLIALPAAAAFVPLAMLIWLLSQT